MLYFKLDSFVHLPVTSVLFFLLRQKEKIPKEKGDFFANAPRQKKAQRCVSSSLFSLVALVFCLSPTTI